jgi:WD40 repeat protein
VSPVFDVRFSPDQKALATSCLESAITLWDLAERREAAIFKGHAGQWISISFSPDSKLLVSAGQDGKLRVWNAALKKPTELESVPKKRIARLALSPNSRHIALWSLDAEILLFETHSGKLRNRWAFDGGDAVRFGDDHGALSFSSDGRLLAASHDDTVRIVDMDSERLLHNLVGGSARVVALSFAPGADTLAAASAQTIRVWNARSGVLLEVIRGSGGIQALSISPDGSAIAFGGFIWGDRNKLTLWDRKLERPSLIVPADGIGIRAIAFSPDGQTLAFGTGDGDVRLWDIEGGREKVRLAGHRGPIVAVCFSSDGKNLITASVGGSTKIWQLRSFREAGDLTTRCKGIHSAGLSTDGDLFLLGSRAHGIQLFRADPFERTDAAPASAQEYTR